MRRIPRLFLGVTAAALLIAGCGSEDEAAPGDPADKPGAASSPAPARSTADADPLPVRITGPQQGVAASGSDMEDPPGRPGRGADFTSQVEYALQGDLLSDARVEGRTTAVCPDGVTRKANASSACIVTYEGVEIPYTVTIGESYEEGDVLTPYRAEPKKRLLLAKRVHDAFWEQFGGSAGMTLSCADMPVAEAVDEGAPTGHLCRTVRDGGRVADYEVTVDSYGPRFGRVQD
ncbi:hypothetical protein [Streptomyces fragilis]|uniref:Lipoprotein n=1 Tax=Streptomyces fragilis TaxID=67301 RepID=A0ABV2YBF7_9ACTN|nr:hypothetical protein [Streptomyces fragilis]